MNWTPKEWKLVLNELIITPARIENKRKWGRFSSEKKFGGYSILGAKHDKMENES